MFNIEYKRRQAEFFGACAVGGAEIVRDIGHVLVPMPDFLAWHAGDFSLGYIATWFSNATMDLTSLRKIPNNVRENISAGIGLGTILAAELLPIPGADSLDIPAGVLGVLGSYGVRKLVHRFIASQ